MVDMLEKLVHDKGNLIEGQLARAQATITPEQHAELEQVCAMSGSKAAVTRAVTVSPSSTSLTYVTGPHSLRRSSHHSSHHSSHASLAQAFKHFDKNKNNSLNKLEFAAAMRSLDFEEAAMATAFDKYTPPDPNRLVPPTSYLRPHLIPPTSYCLCVVQILRGRGR